MIRCTLYGGRHLDADQRERACMEYFANAAQRYRYTLLSAATSRRYRLWYVDGGFQLIVIFARKGSRY